MLHDVRRNLDIYMDSQNDRIDRWIGDPEWRERWADEGGNPVTWLGRYYARRLHEEFGYLPIENRYIVEVKNRKGVLLYWLTFHSKHERGMEFWRDTRRRAGDQPSFL